MAFDPPSTEQIAQIIKEAKALSFIEKGGFKAVYKCQINKKSQALKLIQIPPAQPGEEGEAEVEELLHRIKREINILRKCRSPQIVKLGPLSPQRKKIAGDSYVVYSEEFLDGKNLWTLLRAKGPKPPEKELRALFRSLLLAIKELWSHRIIHRDIKPKNVVKLSNPKRPFVLLDLGIAFSRLETPITNTGTPVTHRYFAPEMAQPNFREKLDYRSDLYTAALTIYEYGAQAHPLAKNFKIQWPQLQEPSTNPHVLLRTLGKISQKNSAN